MLILIADGSHNQEVAERLQVSLRTVHADLRSVYAKLGVTTRTAAVDERPNSACSDTTPD